MVLQREYKNPRDFSAHEIRPRKTWRLWKKDCWIHQLQKQDAVDCSEWRTLIKDIE